MNPPQLLRTLHKVPHTTTYFGPQGFALAQTEEDLDQFQQGFASHSDGSSLCGTNTGDWQSNWLVIAIDTELGDPYFIDGNIEQLAVYTAMRDESGWQVEPVASSLNGFLDCLLLLSKKGNQTVAQFVPDETTIQNQTELSQLQDELVKVSGCQGFWSLFFDCYRDWLQED